MGAYLARRRPSAPADEGTTASAPPRRSAIAVDGKTLKGSARLDALEMAVWNRAHVGRRIDGLVHHSDRGTQYLAVRYPQRLAEAGAVASVGTTGDSYDNALAEAFHSLLEAELVRNRGPWKNLDEVEIAVAEYVDWFNHRRLHGEIGLVPPVEFETDFHQHESASVEAEALVPSGMY